MMLISHEGRPAKSWSRFISAGFLQFKEKDFHVHDSCTHRVGMEQNTGPTTRYVLIIYDYTIGICDIMRFSVAFQNTRMHIGPVTYSVKWIPRAKSTETEINILMIKKSCGNIIISRMRPIVVVLMFLLIINR